MKKIVIAVISTFVLMTCFSNAFATITLDDPCSTGQFEPLVITSVEYNIYYNQPSIKVVFLVNNQHFKIITFTDTDLMAGEALLSAAGKTLSAGCEKTSDRTSRVFAVSVSQPNP